MQRGTNLVAEAALLRGRDLSTVDAKLASRQPIRFYGCTKPGKKEGKKKKIKLNKNKEGTRLFNINLSFLNGEIHTAYVVNVHNINHQVSRGPTASCLGGWCKVPRVLLCTGSFFWGRKLETGLKEKA